MTLVIAQLTDIHLGFGSGGSDEPNAQRLAAVLDTVRELAPDLVFVTGDLTQGGRPHDYARLAAALADLPCPVHLTVGNHDRRAAFAAAFPDTPMPDGFAQYVVEHPALRCIVLDTLREGRHGGSFCEVRAAWLAARLAESEQPTLILLHHPPVAVGIAWMDPDPNAAWIARLRAAVAPHLHVVGMVAGHLHGASVSHWEGITVAIAPSVAPGLALSLAPIDPHLPDQRPMILDSTPGFALHRWHDGQLTTHFARVPGPIIAQYDETLQPMVQEMIAERRAG